MLVDSQVKGNYIIRTYTFLKTRNRLIKLYNKYLTNFKLEENN